MWDESEIHIRTKTRVFIDEISDYRFNFKDKQISNILTDLSIDNYISLNPI